MEKSFTAERIMDNGDIVINSALIIIEISSRLYRQLSSADNPTKISRILNRHRNFAQLSKGYADTSYRRIYTLSQFTVRMSKDRFVGINRPMCDLRAR